MKEDFKSILENLINQKHTSKEASEYINKLLEKASELDEYEILIDILEQTIEHALAQGIPQKNLSNYYYSLAIYCNLVGDYFKAIETLIFLKSNIEFHKPELQTLIFNELGTAFREIRDYERSDVNYREGIKIAEKFNLKREKYMLIMNHAITLALANKPLEAFLLFARSLKKSDKYGLDKGTIIRNLGKCLSILGEHKKANEILLEEIESLNSAEEPNGILQASSIVADNFQFHLNDLEHANYWYEIAVLCFEMLKTQTSDPCIRGAICDDNAMMIGNAINCSIKMKNFHRVIRYLEAGRFVLDREIYSSRDISDKDIEELLSNVGNNINDKSAIIYIELEKNWPLIIILSYTNKGYSIKQLSIETETIEGLYQLLNKNMDCYDQYVEDSNENTKEDWIIQLNEVLRFLGNKILYNVIKILNEKSIRNIYFIDSGLLSNIPVHAAIISGAQSDEFLCDLFNIAFIPSITMLNQVFTQKKLKSKIYTIANPDDTLKWSGKEIDFLSEISLTEGIELRNLSTSNPNEIVDHFKNANILHISTHGKFDWQQTAKSAIKLKNSELTLDDLFLFKKAENLNLVNLSACSSGMGRNWRGSSAISLKGAFFNMGTNAVISASWIINDYAGYIFNKKFYEIYLKKGENKAKAFKEAINKLRSDKLEFNKAIHWAAFKYHGCL
ncbi:CHAT domain-containing protein [Thermodesulfobacteriota bacterium]